MKWGKIDVKKLSSAFYMSIAYKINKQMLAEKEKEIDKMCKDYQKKTFKKLFKSDMNAETAEKVELEIAQKVGEYRIELNREKGVYKLKDELYGVGDEKGLEELVLIKNNNPLHDNFVPDKVTLLRSYYESMKAKYGQDLFIISHKNESVGQSSFNYWKSKLEQIDGHKYSDTTLAYKTEDGYCARKVVMPRDLKRYGVDSYIFESEEAYKKFLSQNKVFEYHAKEVASGDKLKAYAQTDYDFDFLNKFVYAEKINPIEVSAFSQNFLDSIWETYEYKNNIRTLQQNKEENL